jgi:hypothetical protein
MAEDFIVPSRAAFIPLEGVDMLEKTGRPELV